MNHMGEVVAIGKARKPVSKECNIHANLEKSLNLKETKALFVDNAFCIEHVDVVDAPCAVRLFGLEAVHFAIEKGFDTGKATVIPYRIGEDGRSYLTMYGFLVAATYHNVNIVHGEQGSKRKHARQ